MQHAWQVYGFGLSEEILGAAIKETGLRPFIATKFAPLPWRFSSESVVKALRQAAPPTACLPEFACISVLPRSVAPRLMTWGPAVAEGACSACKSPRSACIRFTGLAS